MEKIETIYTEIYGKLKELAQGKEDAERQLQEISARNQELFQKLDSEIGAGLQEVDEKLSRVNVFVNFAREHTAVCEMSPDVLPYNVGELNRLMVLVEHHAADDRNARRLYTAATGQLKGLAAGKNRLRAEGEEKKQRLRAAVMPMRTAALKKRDAAVESFRAYFKSSRCQSALRALKEQAVPEGTMSIGLRRAAFPVPPELTELAAEALTDLWNPDTGSISIPVTVGVEEGNVCVAEYTNQTENEVLSGIRSILLDGINFTDGDPQYICVFDPVRYNDSALGTLEPLALGESRLIDRVPTSREELQHKLDDILGKINSEDQLAAKNEAYERPVKFYVFHNFPQGYDAAMQAKVRQLCVNAPHGRMNIFLTHNCSEEGNQFTAQNATYTYLKDFGRVILTTEDGYCTDWDKNGNLAAFQWNRVPSALPEELLQRARQKREEKQISVNDYDIQVGIQEMPRYRKGVRKFTNIPYGIDDSGRILTLDFENTNFAAFLCGASRSGKTTLLHTILTGIFQQNHPDDVEVWLIDFKMTEFSRYIKHLPPHVRYIILDESPELVYDILDRLTEILQKRQNIFKGMWQKLEDVPTDRYMPAMFIVVDEFSVMSQIIAESVNDGVNYSEKLQTLLAKGAALGMHFVFSSQGFTSGTRGLNDFSKKQIQQRIAMKTEYAEIKATLDLMDASEQDSVMMKQLPPYQALTRVPADEFGNQLSRATVLYISDYGKQEAMIDAVCRSMEAKPRYDAEDVTAYINKQPLIIDGNVYHPFSDKKEEMLAHVRENGFSLQEDGLWDIFWGEPRRMMSLFPVQIADSYGENVFLLAPVNEREAALSALLSMKQSVDMQHKRVEIWSSRKESLYRQLVGKCGWKSERQLDLEEVCQAIHVCRAAVERKERGQVFYVLIGFESLMLDMSFQEKKSGGFDGSLDSVFRPVRRAETGGTDLLSMLKGGGMAGSGETAVGVQQEKETQEELSEPESLVYDAREDLKYILTQGPRLGYHFLMLFHTMGEFKELRLPGGLFKHKIFFRAPRDEVFELAGSQGKAIASLPEHTFRYTNGLDSLNFRPFLHAGLTLDNWVMNEDGTVNAETPEEENYLL